MTTTLSERERDVLRALCSGLSQKETADAIGISWHTVKFHLRRIYLKLGAKNAAHAAALYVGTGVAGSDMAAGE